MTTPRPGTPAFVAAATVAGLLLFAGCGTETVAPVKDVNDVQDAGYVAPPQDTNYSPGSHKRPPDFMP